MKISAELGMRKAMLNADERHLTRRATTSVNRDKREPSSASHLSAERMQSLDRESLADRNIPNLYASALNSSERQRTDAYRYEVAKLTLNHNYNGLVFNGIDVLEAAISHSKRQTYVYDETLKQYARPHPGTRIITGTVGRYAPNEWPAWYTRTIFKWNGESRIAPYHPNDVRYENYNRVRFQSS
ncbi:unnamed protein product [Toxocara canis]|uniref:Doublecortin domain-containing protein n=1 Tax=Toxocara canis TaxID=6265 RepID=A0A183UFB4_TOXCA|nr:unnamed protein product [Toxocara canis]